MRENGAEQPASPNIRWHRPLRFLGLAGLACAALLVFGAWFFSSNLSCPARPETFEGESNYGKAEWGWFPIGTTCRWTEAENGFDRVEEPAWAPTILVVTMLTTGLGLVAISELARSGRSEGFQTGDRDDR
jgi:hypothetical protein